MKLAVELINNHTDNWFDQETKNVWLDLNVTEQICHDEAIQKAVSDLVSWAAIGNPSLSLFTLSQKQYFKIPVKYS